MTVTKYCSCLADSELPSMYFNYVMIPLASWGAKKPFTEFSMPVLLGMSVQFKQSDTNTFHLHAHQQVVKALMT